MEKIPKLGQTLSARKAQSLVDAMSLPTHKALDLETRIFTVEACVRNMFETIKQFGLYNGLVHEKYVFEKSRADRLAERLRRARSWCARRHITPVAVGGNSRPAKKSRRVM